MRNFGPLLLALSVLLPGCRGEGPSDEVPVSARVSIAPTPPILGPNRIVVELLDPDGAPVEGASLRVEGTMDHAGMVPVVREADPSGGGRHTVPAFEFTMGGDWVLRLQITLPGGEAITREHRVRVVSATPPGS